MSIFLEYVHAAGATGYRVFRMVDGLPRFIVFLRENATIDPVVQLVDSTTHNPEHGQIVYAMTISDRARLKEELLNFSQFTDTDESSIDQLVDHLMPESPA